METQKPIISNQITIEQITKSCDDDIKSFTELFFNLEYTWMHNAYHAFNDIEKYIILVFLTNKTLKTYKEHFFSLSFEKFYHYESIEIEKISIVEIVKELSMSKETVRRKINELGKSGVLKRKNKTISILNPFKDQKPINNIKQLSKLLSFVSSKLKNFYGFNFYNDKYFLNLIKKNYTRHWYTFFKFQLLYILRVKKMFGSLENFYIFSVCTVNQSYNLKNSNIKNEKIELNLANFPKVFANFTKYKSKGLNPTTISDLTGIPRASVIRKLKILIDKNFLIRNKSNLYLINTPKDNPREFAKISNFFKKNQYLLRNFLKDLINQMYR